MGLMVVMGYLMPGTRPALPDEQLKETHGAFDAMCRKRPEVRTLPKIASTEGHCKVYVLRICCCAVLVSSEEIPNNYSV